MTPFVGLLAIAAMIYYLFGRSTESKQFQTQSGAIDPRYFVVKPDGLVYFNATTAPVVRSLLANMAVAPVQGDPKFVELVPYTFGQAVTALAWSEALRKQNLYIVVSRWAHVPIAQPRFARAVGAYGVASYATPSGDFALLEPEGVALTTSTLPMTDLSPQQTSTSPQQTSTSPQQTSTSPQQTSTSPQQDPWASLPKEIAEDVKTAYDKGTDPIALEAAAKELDRLGYPAPAAQYRQKAKAMRAGQSSRTITLREGDNPSYLAKHFTGDGARWKEMLASNPSLSVVTVEGRTFVQPWKANQKVILPNDWDIAKGMPPKLTNTLSVPPTGGL